MIRIEFLRHSDCSKSDLERISRFKNLNWQYPIESHLEWMEKNLTGDDIHFLLFDEDALIGYLNLADTSICGDSYAMKVYGIGNVCIHPDCKGMGLGLLLMSASKYYCRKNGRIGILLCQDKNVGFYEVCNWFRYEGNTEIAGNHGDAHINFYSSSPLTFKTIKIERDF